MSKPAHQLKASDSHSSLKKNKVLDFASLSEEEKQQYISLLQKNQVKVENGLNENILLSQFKVTRPKTPEKMSKKPVHNVQSSTSFRATPPLEKKGITSEKLNTKGKNESRDKSPANTSNASRGRPFKDNDNSSLTKKKSTSKSPLTGKNQRNPSPEIQRVRLEKYNEALYENSAVNVESMNSQKRLGTSCSERLNTDPSNSKRSKSPVISEGTKECCNYYKDFCNLANISESLGHIRPKKYSYETLNKIIEEIFAARFAVGSEIQQNYLYSKTSHESLRSNQPFYIFVFDFYKMKAKNSAEPLEQIILNFAYSVYWFRKKGHEVELFSKFLTGESNDDELAFFLLIRFYTEKELNLILCNWLSSTNTIMMSLRNCYRVLEMAYGADEKDFIFRIVQRIKDSIEEKRVKKHDFGLEGTPIYSFLSIGLETYCITKADQEISESFNVDTINETAAEDEESCSEATSDKMPWNSPLHQDMLEHNSKRTSFGQRNNSGLSTADKLSSNANSILLGINDKAYQYESKRIGRTSPENPSYQSNKQYKQGDQQFLLLSGLRQSMNGSRCQNSVPTVSSRSNSPQRMRKAKPNSEKEDGGIDELQALCLKIMLEKIDEFINTTLFKGKNIPEPLKEAVQVKLLRIFTKKFVTLIKALFSFDKMRWFDALVIEDPESSQIQNIEDLQKDLRKIKRKPTGEIKEKDLTQFINKILRTPELSVHIGRLILEFDSCRVGQSEGK